MGQKLSLDPHTHTHKVRAKIRTTANAELETHRCRPNRALKGAKHSPKPGQLSLLLYGRQSINIYHPFDRCSGGKVWLLRDGTTSIHAPQCWWLVKPYRTEPAMPAVPVSSKSVAALPLHSKPEASIKQRVPPTPRATRLLAPESTSLETDQLCSDGTAFRSRRVGVPSPRKPQDLLSCFLRKSYHFVSIRRSIPYQNRRDKKAHYTQERMRPCTGYYS